MRCGQAEFLLGVHRNIKIADGSASRILHRAGDAPPVFEELAVVLLAADGDKAVALSRQGQGVRAAARFGKDGAGFDADFFSGD